MKLLILLAVSIWQVAAFSQELAWGTKRQAWTDHMMQEIRSKTWKDDIKNHCKQFLLEECVAQTLSIMAKRESGFNPKARYEEAFRDKKGNPVISRGLFQLSVESANQKAYGCNIKNSKELHDPLINISCAVKIANHWLNKDKIFFTPKTKETGRIPHFGFSRYWSVARPSSGSFPEVQKYLEKF